MSVAKRAAIWVRVSALVICLVLMACQTADTTSTLFQLPASRDAGVQRAHDSIDLANRVAALDRLRDRIASTERKRNPLEAPVALSNAYVDLELAYGYARLGKADRATALVVTAHTAIGADAMDPVHDVLLAEFTARIDQAIAGHPATAAMPRDVEARLAALDRVARYKVDRLREVSDVLAPGEKIDAIGNWIQPRDPLRRELERIRASAPDVRASAIGKIIDDANWANESERATRLSAACDALLGLSPDLLAPLLSRAVTAAGSLPPALRTEVGSHAVLVAASIGDTRTAGELAPTLTDLGSPDDRPEMIERIVRAFVDLRMTSELTTVLSRLEPQLVDKAPLDGFAIAGGWFALGQSARAEGLMAEADRIARTLSQIMPTRMAITRARAFAYSNANLAVAEQGLTKDVEQFSAITDSYGTNSHYCRSVVQDVESFVEGLVPLDTLR